MSEAVMLPDAPLLGGLSFRYFRDTQDYLRMAAVHAGAQHWDQVDPLSAREHVPTATDLAATFPEADARGNPDLLLVLIDGNIVGFAHVWWRWTEATGTRVYLHLGYLLPQWRRRGIGSAMLRWSQGRIRELARDEQHPGPATFATNVSSTEREADALIRQDGYGVVRRLSDMALTPLTPPPPLALPPGITLRPLEPPHHRKVYRAWKDAFAELWTSTPESEEDFGEFVDDNFSGPSFDPTLCHIAWSADEVAGLVFSRLRQGIATILEVAVRKVWQRRGLGRALMA
jgi:mycothiol synthase